MRRTIAIICILVPLFAQAQDIKPMQARDPSLFEKIYPLLGEEMVITNSYRPSASFGVILIEESHVEQKNNTIFLARLVERLNIRKIGLEGLSFSIPFARALIPKDFTTESGLLRAYCFDNLEDSHGTDDNQMQKLSNAEYLYLNYDSIQLVPIESDEVYNKIANKLFESPAYYLQTAGIGIIKEKDIETLSNLLSAKWLSIQKYTELLRSVKRYIKDNYKSKNEFFNKFNSIINETIDFNQNALDRDAEMIKAIYNEVKSEKSLLPVIIGAAHTYNLQLLLKSMEIPYLTVMSSATAQYISNRKKRPPNLLVKNFNKHIEEKALELIMINSYGDSALLNMEGYFSDVCHNFKYIDPKSIRVGKKSKTDTDVLRYSFRWNEDANVKKRKITLRQTIGDELEPQQSYKDLLRFRKRSVTLKDQINAATMSAPDLNKGIDNYYETFNVMADEYIQQIRNKLTEKPGSLEHIPSYPQVSQVNDESHFFYNGVVTNNGRLNYCKKYECARLPDGLEDDVDSLSGVFTRYYGANVKDPVPEVLLIISRLDDYFNDPTLRIKDLGIHLIIAKGGSKKKQINSKLTQELETKKEELKLQGIKSNIFLRIDFLD